MKLLTCPVTRTSPDSCLPSPVLRDYHATTLAAARRSAEELVRAGWHTGPVPYGYLPACVRISPHGRRPRHRTRLIVNRIEALVVQLIFLWRVYLEFDIDAITRGLLHRPRSSPGPVDPETGLPRAWTPALVRAVLNPKYTGRQVWGRHHHGRRIPRAQWFWPETWVHPPLITVAEFTAANRHQWLAETSPTDNGAMTSAGLPDRRAA